MFTGSMNETSKASSNFASFKPRSTRSLFLLARWDTSHRAVNPCSSINFDCGRKRPPKFGFGHADCNCTTLVLPIGTNASVRIPANSMLMVASNWRASRAVGMMLPTSTCKPSPSVSSFVPFRIGISCPAQITFGEPRRPLTSLSPNDSMAAPMVMRDGLISSPKLAGTSNFACQIPLV